ncbi:MAG TPA: hypothetical protein VLE91_03225 [Candidatus Saccharimonadales bacterium]|nr:hypothetical protein [Candidatus Saccharimonadales bacterium]
MNLQFALILNSTVALAITIKSIYDTITAITHIENNPKLTSRIFFIFTPLFGEKKEKPWGIVYDSVTKLPIDPAIVTIAVDENGVGEYKQTRITDLEGRFSFLVTPAKYVLKAEKTHYKFPSEIVKGKTDGKYKNVYHGEIIEVENPYIINLNIPMDPVDFDWNQSIKHKETSTKNIILDNIRLVIIVVGIAVSADIYLLTRQALYLTPIAIYLLDTLFIRTNVQKTLWGTVYDKKTHQPIPRARIKAFRLPHKLRVAYASCDHLGRYFLLLSHGSYTIEVESEKDHKPLAKIDLVEVKKGKEVIDFDIPV